MKMMETTVTMMIGEECNRFIPFYPISLNCTNLNKNISSGKVPYKRLCVICDTVAHY